MEPGGLGFDSSANYSGNARTDEFPRSEAAHLINALGETEGDARSLLRNTSGAVTCSRRT